jgi:hypothetical protein
MSLPLTSKASKLLLALMALRMIGPPSLPKPLQPSQSLWTTCLLDQNQTHVLSLGMQHLAGAQGLHKAYCRFKFYVSLAFDVCAQLCAVKTELLQRRRRNNCARECSADYSVEYIGVGVDGRVADIEHVKGQAFFDGPGN